MKKFFDGLKFGLGFFMFILLGAFVLKAAWTSTNPGTTDSNLFINQTGSLTKDKWNVLAKKTLREDFSTSDTNPFNVNCERRWKAQYSSTIYWFYSTQMPNDGARIENYSHSNYRQILNTNKTTISTNDGHTRNILKIERKCQ